MSEESISNLDPNVVREALLQEKEDGATRCLTCSHRCLIHEGETGICGTRANIDGSINTLVYGNISSTSNNPIEKKPFFHFAPGTMAYTVGSWGCNASCEFCQNFDISTQEPTPELTRYMSPEQFVRSASRQGGDGISISFSEAATLMLEWNVEVFSLAKDRSMYNTIVTNGYMTTEALNLLIEAGLDAANVDIKGCEPAIRKICGIGLQPVLANVIFMIERGVHVELTTLVVPGLSDNTECLDEIATWILENTGKKTPWHLNRYHPAYKYTETATSVDLLTDARQMAMDKGLEFVYVGNVGRAGLEDTVCPKCGTVCMERSFMASKNVATTPDGKCESCGYDLAIMRTNAWEYRIRRPGFIK